MWCQLCQMLSQPRELIGPGDQWQKGWEPGELTVCPPGLQAVKAMQFEGMESTKKLETAETIRERAMQDEELAKQIQEEEGDDF